MIEFFGSCYVIVLNFEWDFVGVVVMGLYVDLKEGDKV